MINQSSVEALYSGAFVENYFDCVENLPDDVQRYMTRMRELDVTYRAYLRDVETHLDMCIASPKDEQGQGKAYSKAYLRVQKSLIAAQELGDEKLQIMQVLQDVIDNKSRQLNLDHRKLVSCLEFNTNGNIKEEPVPLSPPAVKELIPPPLVTNNNTLVPHQHTATNNNAAATPPHIQEKEKEKSDKDNKNSGERASKRPRRTRNDTQSGADSGGADPGPSHTVTNTNTTTQKKGMGKKKKRKARQSAAQSQREETPPPEEPDPIDPDEPTYCLCDQISFGEMILCDNDLCPIEWFHFSCVSLTTKPKGKWFCPKCRGDRPNVMKPKVQFLKELEQYNKLKEDKA